jgi:parallel beta-helix repeat protein
MILRDGVELKVVTTSAACVPGTVYVQGNQLTSPNNLWFQGTRVWVADDPTGHEMRYSNKCMLMQFNTGPLTIRGIGIRRYASFVSGSGAFYIQNTSVTFENVWFEHFSALGFKFSGGANSTFRNCTAYYFGFGFLWGSGDNMLYDSCDFRYQNYRKFNSGGPTCAVLKIEASTTVTCKNSNFTDSHCKGFWTDRTVNHPWIYNTYFQRLGDQIVGFIGTTASAVDLEGSADGLVANCLITNIGGQGIWNNDSSACRYYNNTIVDTHRSGIDGTGHIVGGGPFTIGQSDRRPWENNSNYSKDYTWMNTMAASYYTDPDHQFACRNFWLYNNVLCISSGGLGGPAQTLFSCQSQADTSIANPAIGGPSDGARGFTAFIGSGGMDSNVYWTEAALQYAFLIITNGNTGSPTVYNGANQGTSLSTFRTAYSQETNGTQRAFGLAAKPIDANYKITDATLHTKATALPSDIATLIGQAAGVKRAGCFLVGV